MTAGPQAGGRAVCPGAWLRSASLVGVLSRLCLRTSSPEAKSRRSRPGARLRSQGQWRPGTLPAGTEHRIRDLCVAGADAQMPEKGLQGQRRSGREGRGAVGTEPEERCFCARRFQMNRWLFSPLEWLPQDSGTFHSRLHLLRPRCPSLLSCWTLGNFLRAGATKDMGKMLGGDEEKDPDAAKKEEERQEALRQEEEERKAKYAKMEAEREAMRQGIRDKYGIKKKEEREAEAQAASLTRPKKAIPPGCGDEPEEEDESILDTVIKYLPGPLQDMFKK
ncbi:hypothetical protein CB1_000328013 [Camelus ferus]|nr:hypothetical protein CB1_000328013 [Camelus ferus]